MSISQQDAPLVLALAELARTSPRTWSDVVAELKKRSDHVRYELVSATADVLVHQGRARESQAMFKLVEDCVREADAIKAHHQRAQTQRPRATNHGVL